ncbi:hypothetical protein EVAR_77473_1 [Eumeta japonica]|uniref:Uncharacterized protein n=1 Tax=Eumeta variegata TaxID=151549 RepID=A0A4C1T7B2_EUMVA|nr:hypothetical protein EVAR_77473_1 [Eumeta japonica]
MRHKPNAEADRASLLFRALARTLGSGGDVSKAQPRRYYEEVAPPVAVAQPGAGRSSTALRDFDTWV